jgi:hypothetical protein
VKAIYTDGTQSRWSNTQRVTLLAGSGHMLGDVNHDGEVSIEDVSLLIDYLMTDDAAGVCLTCADINGDGEVSIGDVSALIDKLLTL